jgi:2'-hydroxyisoflavone reductase
MKLLVLGGTVFVGRHIVEAALGRGYDVTLFNRGQHGAGLFPEVEKLRGDRDGDLRALEGRTWDAVVDTSGYFPRVVRTSAERLADRLEHYTFISSGSVYADVSRPGVDESAAVHELPEDEPEELASPEAYGGFKALAEQAAEEAMPGRVLNVRAGIIVGPYDPTNRFTYWVTRIADGGDVLAPEPRDQPIQFIDARDLATWILDMAAARSAGVYNVVGPDSPMTMERLLEGIVAAVGDRARLVWVPERFLLAQGVEAFEDLPLWLAPTADPEYAGFFSVDGSKALAAGLRFRPLAETVSDLLAWARSGGAPEPKDIGVAMAPAGLGRERENAILDSWRSRSLP